MGNSASKKRKNFGDLKGSSTDVEPRSLREFSPWRRARSEDEGDCRLCDVPGKPGKAVVSLTNLQSDKPRGDCVTDSIYLDWRPPAQDGGRPVLGYTVEMYDLPTGNWVTVTNTEGDLTRSMLDGILCGIMYRFRVRAFNEVGNSVPGIPSDSFVIDTPGVTIAPYFILCPPADTCKYQHQTVQFRAKALGTPKPNILWQKDEEPIFITEGIDIQEEPDGSLLTVHNLQLDDEGVIQCVAVNHVGKATASTALSIVAVPKFSRVSDQPLHYTFRAEEMVRLKFPLLAQPAPLLTLLKDGSTCLATGAAEAALRQDGVLFRIESAAPDHVGHYTVIADNGHGEDRVEFGLEVEVPPESPAGLEVVEVSASGQLELAWAPPSSGQVDHYIVEYWRDQWQLWLRLKTSLECGTRVTDLIPGSQYKFRVLAASMAGISDPSQESELVMIGQAAEDELFDLPSARGRSSSRLGRRLGKMSSMERGVGGAGLAGRRQTSLDREVYYDADNVRRDVVTYKPPTTEKLGSLSARYQLSSEDMNKYKSSLSELCHRMKAVSAGSRVSLEEAATQPLKREVLAQARRYCSVGEVDGGGGGRLAGDLAECRASLTDIRDRIGSLQSLLRASRTLTGGSAQKLEPAVRPAAAGQQDRKISFTSHRSDSYARAMDDEAEGVQETHFPYSPASTSLLCDQPENRQAGSRAASPALLSTTATTTDNTLLVEEETDRTISACSTLDGDEDMATSTESLL